MKSIAKEESYKKGLTKPPTHHDPQTKTSSTTHSPLNTSPKTQTGHNNPFRKGG